MFRTTLSRITQYTFEQFPIATLKPNINKQSNWNKIATIGLSVFAGYLWKNHSSTNRYDVVFAMSHHDDSHVKRAMQEIAEHQLWHLVGHVVGLGSFAAGILAGALSFQSLGEKDTFYIPRPISPPIMTKCINPENNRLEDCLIINGRKLVGQDIIRFLNDIMYIQISKNFEKRKKH